MLTTYPLLARDHEVLLAQEFHVAILDEAQAIKTPLDLSEADISALFAPLRSEPMRRAA